MDRFVYNIFKFCREGGLIEDNDKIVVSFSGGIDSMSLFRLLLDFREKIRLNLCLVHFNHGLREESKDEEKFLIKLAGEKSIPIKVVKTDRFNEKSGMQNKARDWRRHHLRETMKSAGFDKIALGHQLDDLIETQIWKILRGASLFSLNPIQAKELPYIRPLLRVPKKDLEKYLLNINQKWCQDESNFTNHYTRNLIRNKLIPVMKECVGGRLEEKFAALSDDAEKLKEMFKQLAPPKMYQSDHLKYKDILELPALMGQRLIERFLVYHNQPEINRSHIDQAYRLVKLNTGGWSISLKNNRRLVGKKQKVTLLFDE